MIIGIDQNYTIRLAEEAIAVHRGQPGRPVWRDALEALHDAVHVRAIAVCPLSLFTRHESRTNPDVVERNDQLGRELGAGAEFRSWSEAIEWQLTYRLIELRGGDPRGALAAPGGLRDPRLYIDSGARSFSPDPVLENLCFRVDWAYRKLPKRADPEASDRKWRLGRVYREETRMILDADCRAALFVKDFLSDGYTFNHVYRAWRGEVEAPYQTLPDREKVAEQALETFRAVYPGIPYEIVPGFPAATLPPQVADMSLVDVAFARLIEDGVLATIPSAEIYGRLTTALARETQRSPDANDVIDVLRAAVILPVAALYGTDNAMKSRLVQTKLRDEYGVEVFGGSDCEVAAFAKAVRNIGAKAN